MTQQMIICFVIFVVMIILFFTNKIPMSFTALNRTPCVGKYRSI